jgi:predicted HTH transcriptional regulator
LKTKTHPIKELILQGEGLHLDFKFEISDAAKIARSLVAFANTEGGKLLVGVKDNGSIAGIRSEEEFYMIQNAAHRFCQPVVHFTSKEWVLEGKKVLEINIPSSPDFPYRAPDNNGNFKAFIRVADENLLADGVMMKIWKKRKENITIHFHYREAEEKLLKILRKENKINTIRFMQLTGVTKYDAEQILSDLVLLKILELKILGQQSWYFLNENADKLIDVLRKE